MSPVSLRALRQTLQQATYFIRKQDPDTEVYIVQESSLGFEQRHHLQVDQFTLVMSQYFSALLLVHELPEGGEDYPIELIFESKAIAQFLHQLMEIIPEENTLQTSLKHGLTLFRSNHPNSQSQFTLKLMDELSQLHGKTPPPSRAIQSPKWKRAVTASNSSLSPSVPTALHAVDFRIV